MLKQNASCHESPNSIVSITEVVVNKKNRLPNTHVLSWTAAVLHLDVVTRTTICVFIYVCCVFVFVVCLCWRRPARAKGRLPASLGHTGSSLQRWEWAMLLGLSTGPLSTRGGGGGLQWRRWWVGGEQGSTLWATLPCRCPRSDGTATSVLHRSNIDFTISSRSL